MAFAVVAVLSGALLYVACAAAAALHAAGASGLWWLAVAIVVLCHAGAGYAAMARGAEEDRTGVFATEAAISLGITGIVLGAALLLAFRFPIQLAPGTAMLMLGASVVASSGTAAVAIFR